jgi:starvation-inducible DNA-binding protein
MNFRIFFLVTLFLSNFLHAQTKNDIDLVQNEFAQDIKNAQNQKPSPQPITYAVNKSFVVRHTNIGLSSEGSVEVVNSLRKLLADNYVLYTKALNFHWNVEGELFSQLHEFFKKLYESLQDDNDLLAERIRALGSYSPGSLQEFLTLTQLHENLGKPLPYLQMLQIVLDDFETVIRSVRQTIELSAQYNDWGTNNMLSDMIQKQEKNAWMIRAHLQKK